jgi:hypothetical protein
VLTREGSQAGRGTLRPQVGGTLREEAPGQLACLAPLEFEPDPT